MRLNKGAFYNCSSLTSITIPDSVTSIGSSAFRDCKELTSVTIPNSVTSIGGAAFYNCSNLTSITIPESVTSIGRGAFYGCSGLTSVTIPDSVTSIGSSAFYDCTGLTSITIGNSVTSIGSSAFYDCSGLTTVNWNTTACTIAGSSYYPIFQNCSKLTTVYIGDNVTTIPSYAFAYCSGLKTVFYAGTEEQWKAISIGSYNSSLTSATRVYDSNGAEHTYSFVTNCEQSVDPITATYLTSLPTLTKDGFYFGGWYDNEAFEGKAVSAPYGNKDKTTLYAKWLTEEEWSLLPDGTSFEKAFIAESGKTYDVNVTTGGQIVYFAFTPTTTGSFTIQSTGSGDTYGTLYSSSKSSLTTNDDDGNGRNFKITYAMTAGTTYYVAVKFLSSSTTGTFKVSFS